MTWIGVLAGAFIGLVWHGFRGAVVGALAGLAVAALFRRDPAAGTAEGRGRASSVAGLPPVPMYRVGSAAATSGAQPAAAGFPADGGDPRAVAEALARIERRLAALEATLGLDAAAGVAAPGDADADRHPSIGAMPAETRKAPDVQGPGVPVGSPETIASTPFATASDAGQRAAAAAPPDALVVPPPAMPPSAPVDAAFRPDGTPQASDGALSAPVPHAPDGTLHESDASAQAPDRTLAMRSTLRGAEPLAPAAPPHAAAQPVAGAPSATPPPAPRYGVPQAPSQLWAWVAGGNALTRVGVVILFFGVAFLLRYFTERFAIPLEWRLAAVAAFGIALAVLGAVLAPRRPGYGVSLIGAGGGVLYLTAFGAFRFYAVLPPTAALVLLVVVVVAVVTLAMRSDSQALAGLALAGGFLAPVLVSDRQGEPALLFGYFAVLNAGILVIALGKAWRALNVLGFVFTFGLALVWGWDYYRPAHYATVQPFLALFFLFYAGIAILHAFRAPRERRAAVDAILVFGVPLVGFALQTGIVRGFPYGVAWSAVAVGVVYAVLALLLRIRAEPGVRLLAASFLALAILFGTIAIPYAADPHWTSAWWALEAAAVFWVGCVQAQRLPRALALVLQLAAALAFAWGAWHSESERLFLNALWLGTAAIGLAGFATAFVADRHADRLAAVECTLVPWVFGWGAAWWLGGGVREIERHLSSSAQPNAGLAFVLGSVAAALLLQRALAWPRLAWIAVAVPAAMLFSGLASLDAEGTTLLHGGYAVWPLAWALLAGALLLADRLAASAGTGADRARARAARAHVAAAVALVAWLSWEASEWVGRWTDEGTAWITCATALPPILFLAAATRWRAAQMWPMAPHGATYARAAGAVIAGLLLAWFVMANLLSPGDPAPLPYVPLANPLELILALALWLLYRWSVAVEVPDPRTRFGVLAGLLFVAVNGGVVRAVHHGLDVPWTPDALLAFKPLQAALTLTWTVTALPVMVVATRRRIRPLWMAGAALLALVVLKLFLADLSGLSGLPRVVAFLGAGLLLLVIGYFAPLPPADDEARHSMDEDDAPAS